MQVNLYRNSQSLPPSQFCVLNTALPLGAAFSAKKVKICVYRQTATVVLNHHGVSNLRKVPFLGTVAGTINEFLGLDGHVISGKHLASEQRAFSIMFFDIEVFP